MVTIVSKCLVPSSNGLGFMEEKILYCCSGSSQNGCNINVWLSEHINIILHWPSATHGVFNVWRNRMTDIVNESVNYGGDCRTAPATSSLLKRKKKKVTHEL